MDRNGVGGSGPTDMTEKKRWRRATQPILLISLFALIIWDVVVAITPESGDTISENTRDYSIYPILPAMLGGLCGHFFFWEIRVVPEVWGLIISVGFLILLGIWSGLTKNQIGPQWLINSHLFCSRHPSIVCVSAMILGGLFWGLPPSSKTL